MTDMKIQRGFSMIEAMITVAIMGILLAAAMPSMGDWIRNMRVRNTAESILNGLQQARNAAVARNKPATLYLVTDLTSSCALSSSSGTWVVSAASPVGKCDLAPSLTGSTQIVAKGLASDGGGATVAATKTVGGAAATSVTFSGLGMLSQASVANAIRAINVSSADGTSYVRRVELSTAGVARLCDPAVSTNGDARKCTQ
jgi:type IV fimbrial biogenesis protein FimT